MKTELRGYAKRISELTGYTDPRDVAKIEEAMRQDVFHSTLDWQTPAQFKQGAKVAVRVLKQVGVL